MDRLDSQELILDLCGFIETCVYWILTKVELHVNIIGTSFLHFQHLFLGPLYKIRYFFSLSQGDDLVFFNNPGNSCINNIKMHKMHSKNKNILSSHIYTSVCVCDCVTHLCIYTYDFMCIIEIGYIWHTCTHTHTLLPQR